MPTFQPQTSEVSPTVDSGNQTSQTGTIAAGRVAIVIATHKYCFPLERCISTHMAMLASPADIVFVDNGSGGEMTRWVQQRYPDVTVITREQNGFFCGGYNSGMQYAIENGYEFALIVNADTDVCNPDYIKSLVDAAELNPQAAFLGPKVYLREEGNVQNTILLYPWFGRYLNHWLTARFRRGNRSAEATETTEVEFLNGVCVLCRTAALRDIGLLDEDMGGYVEDTDWSWRARQRNWSSLFVPVPSIVHHQVEDEYDHHSVKSFMLRRNHVYWHMKEGRVTQARLFAAFSFVIAMIRAALSLISRRGTVEHRKYLTRFRRATQGILNRDPPGDWFGPPLGQWHDEVSRTSEDDGDSTSQQQCDRVVPHHVQAAQREYAAD